MFSSDKKSLGSEIDWMGVTQSYKLSHSTEQLLIK
jgi:hypothetical protein